MQQRYYDPVVGRFLSVDPVTALDNGDMRHFNRYSYAYNNPYRFTDPDGRCPMCIGAAVGGLLELGVQIVEIALDQRTVIEVTDIAIAAGAGAMGVGLVTTINRGAKLGSVARAALEVGGDAAVSAGSQLGKDGNVSITDTVVDVVVGQTVGSEAGRAAATRARSSSQGRLLERQANRAERVAAQSTRPARQAAAEAARGAQREHVNGAAAATGASAANAASATVEAACTASGTQAC